MNDDQTILSRIWGILSYISLRELTQAEKQILNLVSKSSIQSFVEEKKDDHSRKGTA
jgi:hypothetical protein